MSFILYLHFPWLIDTFIYPYRQQLRLLIVVNGPTLNWPICFSFYYPPPSNVTFVTIHPSAIFELAIKLFYMKINLGNTDRIIRLFLAAVFATLYFTGTISGTIGIVLLVFAGVFVATSLVSFCPLYALVGFNTCSAKK